MRARTRIESSPTRQRSAQATARTSPQADSPRLHASTTDQMANGGNRMMEHHTWTRITHDGSDAVALLGAIAMIATAFAGCLCVHPSATLRAQDRVCFERRALGTDKLSARGAFGAIRGRMIASAIQCDHLGHDKLLT